MSEIVYVVVNHADDVISPPFASRVEARVWVLEHDIGQDLTQCKIRRARLTIFSK